MDFEESGRGLIEVFPGGTEEIHKTPQPGDPLSRHRFEPSVSGIQLL
jgi:hypothetical protein